MNKTNSMDVFVNNFKSIVNPVYHVNAVGSVINISEKDNDGKLNQTSTFQISTNIPHFSFSLDKRNESSQALNPMEILNTSTKGVCAKNDVIVICLEKDTLTLYVFMIEVKSINSAGAADQIRCGMIFTKYLFELYKIVFGDISNFNIEFKSIIAKKTRKQRDKPTTNPKNRRYAFKAAAHSTHPIDIMEWNSDEKLPLSHIVNSLKK